MWTVQSCWVVWIRGVTDLCLRKEDWLCAVICPASHPLHHQSQGSPRLVMQTPAESWSWLPDTKGQLHTISVGKPAVPSFKNFFFIRCPHGSLLHYILVCAKPSHQETFLADQNQHRITPYFLILLYFSSQHLLTWEVICVFVSFFICVFLDPPIGM